jgi:transcriptional regulator with GAF, ATPase, and Fis domain
MGKIRLKQFLARKVDGASLLHDLANSGLPFQIFDAQQNMLWGDTPCEAPVYPIALRDETLGWVCGENDAQLLALLLSHLVSKEATNGELADEALELYRELNLLFKLSEKLSASLELSTVTAVILEEANRLIQATSGAIIVFDDNREKLITIRAFGSQLPSDGTYRPDTGIIGNLAFSLQGEIINDVTGDHRYTVDDGEFSSLVCVPLKAKGQTIGVLLLVNKDTVTYTSRDFKLLLTLASQAAPAIDNAQLYEKTIREAQIRETQLHKRIEALRIELDEKKQQEKVNEITESEYFQSLRSQTDMLRKIMDDGESS